MGNNILNQQLAVEKVLEEMKKAEEFAMSWNASWSEELLDSHCLPLHYEMGERDVENMEKKYGGRYNLANAFYYSESIGIPLVKEKLVGNNTLTGEKNVVFECEFGRIKWYGMDSHKSNRYFSFSNNGNIVFKKRSKKKNTKKPSKHISYEAYYNVLSSDFVIGIDVNGITHDYFLISIVDNTLIERYNDIEVIRGINMDILLAPENILEIKQVESKVTEILKGIRSELPLPGLVERIDGAISLLNNQKQEKTKSLSLKINK